MASLPFSFPTFSPDFPQMDYAVCRSFAGGRVHFYRKTARGTPKKEGTAGSFGMILHSVGWSQTDKSTIGWSQSEGISGFFQISDSDALSFGVGDFAAGAFADVAADIYDEDFVGHVDLALVHIVQHRLGAFCPDFIITAVTEQPDRNHDVALKSQSFLSLQILFLELCAAAEGYNFIITYHSFIHIYIQLPLPDRPY